MQACPGMTCPQAAGVWAHMYKWTWPWLLPLRFTGCLALETGGAGRIPVLVLYALGLFSHLSRWEGLDGEVPRVLAVASEELVGSVRG